MTWYAVFRTATGELLSLTTAEPTGLPSDLSYRALTSGPNPDLTWSESGRDWVQRPAETLIDRVADISADPTLSTMWGRLTTTQAAALRTRIGLLLGPYRFRRPAEPVDLE